MTIDVELQRRASDRSNIRITTERGAVFVVRIIREG